MLYMLCAHVHVCSVCHTHILTHVYCYVFIMCASQSQHQVSFSVIFYSPLIRQGLSLNLTLTDCLDWLVNSSCLLISVSPAPRLQPCVATLGFLTFVGDLCPGPYSPRLCLFITMLKGKPGGHEVRACSSQTEGRGGCLGPKASVWLEQHGLLPTQPKLNPNQPKPLTTPQRCLPHHRCFKTGKPAIWVK